MIKWVKRLFKTEPPKLLSFEHYIDGSYGGATKSTKAIFQKHSGKIYTKIFYGCGYLTREEMEKSRGKND